MNRCKARHTLYQPEYNWACPFCEGGSIYLKDQAPDASPYCKRLHALEFYFCSDCEITASGKEIAAQLNTCPACSGTGRVV